MLKNVSFFGIVALTLLAGLPYSVSAQTATEPPVVPTSPAPSAAKPAAKPKEPRTPESAVTPVTRPGMQKRHEEFMARAKSDVGLLFIGDSITDFWPKRAPAVWQKFEPYHPADFGVSGERTEHVLWRISNGELEGIKPKVTVVMIGTNNLGHFPDEKPEWTAAGVKKIVETIHAKLPETKVLLLAIFPRDEKENPRRKAVEDTNAIISKLDDGKQTRYLDIGKVFLNDAGEIPPDVMPDRLHPTEKGYGLWYDAMNPTLEEMLK